MNTINPPPGPNQTAEKKRVAGYAYAVLFLVISLATITLILFEQYYVAAAVVFLAYATLARAQRSFAAAKMCEEPLELASFSETFHPTLANGSGVAVEIAIQIPTGTHYTYSRERLRVAGDVALSRAFSELDKVPKLAEIDAMIDPAFSAVYDELKLPLLIHRAVKPVANHQEYGLSDDIELGDRA